MRGRLVLVLTVLLVACSARDPVGVSQTARLPATAPPAVEPTITPSFATTPPTPTPVTPSSPTLPPPTAAPPVTPVIQVTLTPPAPTAPLPSLATRYSYPIGLPGRPPGDGFLIRHGALTENTWYAPGNWHTGEDWYALEGDTGGARVYAAAAGEVVYADANYPGRVVIIAHPDGLYSMYGHLDPRLEVAVGAQVTRGQLLGVVLEQRGARAPSHLHFELRTFLTSREINGDAPRYAFRCGPLCPPGPGYWPITAPDLPSERGWLIPLHVLARTITDETPGTPLDEVLVSSAPPSATLVLWSAPPDVAARRPVAETSITPGERLALLAIWAGEEASRETSALASQLWYHVRFPDGSQGWAQAAVPSADESGGDGRPASLRFVLLPAIEAAP